MNAIEPASRGVRIVLAVFVAILLVAALLLSLYSEAIERWVLDDPARMLDRFEILLAGFAALSIPFLAGAAIAIRLGFRTVASGRYPPKGMLLIADTRVETGPAAIRRGRMLQVFGVVIGAVALCAPATLWLLVRTVVETP